MYRGHDGRFYDIEDHPPTRNGIDGPANPPTAYQTQFDSITNINDTRNQTLGQAGDGTTLGNNMDAVGVTRPPNSDAHHIIAGNSTNTAAVRARQLLDEAGVDVNEAANGVYLPTNRHFPDEVAPNHKRVHTNRYYEAIVDRLNDIDPGDRREEIRKIANELANNLFVW